MFWNKKKRIYLDHAATTPIDMEVLAAMNEVYKNNYFNPGALYREGVLVAQKIHECRKSVAQLLGTTSDHIVFTRGGTESINMAINGVVSGGPKPHVIVSSIEHSAVLETVRYLAKMDHIELDIIPVGEAGVLDVDALKKALKPTTVLVSVMYVNNEWGTIQPIKEIAKLVRWHKKQTGQKNYPLFHTDAIQAVNYLDINVERLGVDMMSLSGSKIYGPKASGVLYVRNKDLISRMFHGGGQELGLRAGTEDIAQIVGFTKALEKTRAMADREVARLTDLQNYFFAELENKIKNFKVNGSREVRVPNNINISFPDLFHEQLVIELDARGICVATRAACKSKDQEESKALRLTMGRMTTKKDITIAVAQLQNIVERIRSFQESMVE